MSRLLAIVGAAGPMLFVVGVIVGAAVTPGYSHRSDPISQLAAFGEPYPAIQMTGFVVFGLSMVAVAAGLWKVLRSGAAARVGTFLVGLAGGSMVLTGFFRSDPLDQETLSASGIVHLATATVLFLSLIAGFLVLSRAMRRAPQWSDLATFSLVAGLAALVFLVTYSFAFELQPEWVGLWQRLLAATFVVWFLVVSRRLSRLDMPPSA